MVASPFRFERYDVRVSWWVRIDARVEFGASELNRCVRVDARVELGASVTGDI